MVLAPHPDDETLGTGALIAETARAGRLAAVAYLTDGEGSHPGGGTRLAVVRRREAGHSLRRLGSDAPVIALGWRDARPHPSGSAAFAASRDRMAALLRRLAVDAIAVTAADEPHCDHVAAHQLARAAVASAHRRVRLFVYHVWSDPPAAVCGIRTALIAPGRRRHALAAHRSQLGPAMGDGFRLPAERLRMPARDTLWLGGRDGRG